MNGFFEWWWVLILVFLGVIAWMAFNRGTGTKKSNNTKPADRFENEEPPVAPSKERMRSYQEKPGTETPTGSSQQGQTPPVVPPRPTGEKPGVRPGGPPEGQKQPGAPDHDKPRQWQEKPAASPGSRPERQDPPVAPPPERTQTSHEKPSEAPGNRPEEKKPLVTPPPRESSGPREETPPASQPGQGDRPGQGQGERPGEQKPPQPGTKDIPPRERGSRDPDPSKRPRKPGDKP